MKAQMGTLVSDKTPSQKAQEAYEQIQRMQEVNRKIKEILANPTPTPPVVDAPGVRQELAYNYARDNADGITGFMERSNAFLAGYDAAMARHQADLFSSKPTQLHIDFYALKEEITRSEKRCAELAEASDALLEEIDSQVILGGPSFEEADALREALAKHNEALAAQRDGKNGEEK